MALTPSLKLLYWDWGDITVCQDNQYLKIKLSVPKHVHYTDVRYGSLKGTSATYLTRFEYGHPWSHEKYPDDIRPLSTCSEA
jgi:hypothetical protein